MAAGLGFKTFTSGEVLTAADTNGYLMQGILVFANASARTAAVTSPQEGQYSYLKDTNALEYYDGAAWVGAPVGDITAVTAGKGLTGGGSSGDVTVSLGTTAKGDLVAGTGTTTAAVLAVGANDTAIVADSTAATGLAYKTKGVFNGLTTTGDTIYSSSGTTQSRLGIGSTGQVLTVAGGVPSWATPTSGFTLINSTNFSGATSFSIDNVFSSTYAYYRIICTNTGGSGSAAEVRINFRTGGVTNSSATYYYGGQARLYASATSDFSNAAAGTNAFVWRTNGSTWSGNLDIYNPFATQATWFNGIKADTYEAGTVGGFFDNTTSFDGFLITNTGATNIAGNCRVYGYAN